MFTVMCAGAVRGYRRYSRTLAPFSVPGFGVVVEGADGAGSAAPGVP